MNSKKRDSSIDILRGIAALIVVMGHAFQRFTNYDDFFAFNLIFSLQMPLFMLISGYCCVFTKRLTEFGEYLTYIKKRTISLLIPWLSWSIIAYVFIGQDRNIWLYIKNTVYHMEDAFWFLFSLWAICLMFGTAEFLSNKISSGGVKKIVSYSLIFLVELTVVSALGFFMGITFLGIKFTLYYSLFYNLGIMLGMLRSSMLWDKLTMPRKIVSFTSMIVYFVLLAKFNIMKMGDNLPNIIVRALISLLGCYLLIEISGILAQKKSKIIYTIEKCGGISLELYVVHWTLMFSGLIVTNNVSCDTILGLLLVFAYFIIVLTLSLLIIYLIKKNSIADFILFGKVKKQKQKGN